MSQTLQLEEIRIIELHDAPKLQVEWSPRWEEFVTSISPAFARSGPRLAGEAPHGAFSYRSMFTALLLELFVVFVFAILPRQIDRLRPYAPPVRPYEVIYYSADELPRVEDLSGAESGRAGRAGGQEAHHRTQTIRVARGNSLASKVVDAPALKLPSSSGAVANLLAFNSKINTDPGPPPAEGLRSALTAPSLPANVIAPASMNVARDRSRVGLSLNSIIPPAPLISADRSRSAPALNSSIIAPAPSIQSEHRLVAPSFATNIIAPAPDVARDRTLTAPALNSTVIGPAAARVTRDQRRSAPVLNGSVIAPAPSVAGHEVSPSSVQMNAAIVPPPVSAPERGSERAAKLRMPAPSVVAPPPSADSARDLRRFESGSVGSSQAVVPPPPAQTGNTSFVSSIIGKLFGAQDVVPPPPAVSAGSAASARSTPNGSGGALSASVIPPPPSASSGASGSSGNSRRAALGPNIVPPPPSVNGSSPERVGSGTARGTSLAANIVPPPPSVAGSSSRGASGNRMANSAGASNGLATNIVPPPPSVDSVSSLPGADRTGVGFGGQTGSVLAPPKSAANDNSGVVLSAQPGSNVAKPGSGGKGALAMSPAGGEKPGLGGSGGGTGIGHGDGPGSALRGENSGAGKTGTGRGSDSNARGGISPTPGPGGAGSSPTGSPAVAGVDVRGGSTVVTLAPFGTDAGSNDPNLPGRTSIKQQQGPAITIVATSRSGGAFDFYGKLPGDNYTVYVDTEIGTAVMQFAEANPSHSQAGALTGPQGIRTNLPADLPRARVVIKCALDASGNLRNLQVLEPGPAAMTAKIMAALPSWKFRPAMRGAQPVEVNAILGFNIDTNDRY